MNATSKGEAARLAAHDLIESVLIRKVPFDDRLAWSLEKGPMKALEPRDRAFTRLIAATTLRRLGQIDELLATRLRNPLPSAAHRIRTILRLAIAELVFIGSAHHATVSVAVTLASQGETGYRYKGLVNAVLRRIAEEGQAEAETLDAAKLNTPEWLWQSWVVSYGEDVTRAIALAHMAEPPLDLSAKGDPADWTEALEAEILPTGTLRRIGGGRIEDLPGFKSGAFWVQDAAAALPALLLGDVTGKQVVDLCAAPGGKSMQLAARGGDVIAVDKSAKRLARMFRNIKRTELKAALTEGDATKWQPNEPVSHVLLDAPCSTTGTMRRHPDVARLKSPDDLKTLLPLQAKMLDNAAKMLAPGGTLVYCVCSLQQEEGADQINAFLQRQDDFERVAVTAEEVKGLVELITPEGDLRTLPSHLSDKGGLDGFYAARLIRKT